MIKYVSQKDKAVTCYPHGYGPPEDTVATPQEHGGDSWGEEVAHGSADRSGSEKGRGLRCVSAL